MEGLSRVRGDIIWGVANGMSCIYMGVGTCVEASGGIWRGWYTGGGIVIRGVARGEVVYREGWY